jgi:hypothetical protein
MALSGMDIDEAVALSDLIRKITNELEQTYNGCTAQVQGLNWLGADSIRYKQETWGTNALQAFKHYQTTLLTCHESLLANIEEQRVATNGGSGASSTPAG